MSIFICNKQNHISINPHLYYYVSYVFAQKTILKLIYLPHPYFINKILTSNLEFIYKPSFLSLSFFSLCFSVLLECLDELCLEDFSLSERCLSFSLSLLELLTFSLDEECFSFSLSFTLDELLCLLKNKDLF